MIAALNLVKTFGPVRAVDGVSFRVEPGEIVGFLGPNGAGKTTTLRVLTGFHPATSGQVTVGGLDVLADSLAVRAGLGYLCENVPIYPDMRVVEYLRYRAALKGVARGRVKARVAEVLELAGIVEVRRKLVAHVSRGYRQRVGLADALVADPPLLVLDEPTSGLDPNQRRKVRELVRGLAGEHTILFSSHILSDVADTCDRILLIHRGKLVADGTIDELARELCERELRLVVRSDPDELDALFEGLPLGAGGEAVSDGAGFLRVARPIGAARGAQEDAVVDALHARLREKGCELRELYVHEPTLEEIFYELTADGLTADGPPEKDAGVA